VDRSAALRLLSEENERVGVEYRELARRIAVGAIEQVTHLRSVPSLLSAECDSTVVYARLVEAARWETQMRAAYVAATHGLQPSLRALWPDDAHFPPCDNDTVESAQGRIEAIAGAFGVHARHVRSLLIVPAPEHPPAHADLHRGINAEVLRLELQAARDGGLARSARLETKTVEPTAAALRGWIQDTARALEGIRPAEPGHPGVAGPFLDCFSGLEATGSSLVADAHILADAYLALGVSYISEVLAKMNDYKVAAGQESGPSIHITANAIYGGQFAARIDNINSAISSVAGQGGDTIAGALRSTAEAVLAEPEFDSESKRDLLDNVGDLAEAAELPASQRNRGRVRAALQALSTAAVTGVELEKAWSTWGQVLHGLLS
jgi:hypothetical protein